MTETFKDYGNMKSLFHLLLLTKYVIAKYFSESSQFQKVELVRVRWVTAAIIVRTVIGRIRT